MSFDSYCEQVSDTLGICFRPDKSYKICDIRPAFGRIHADVIAGFDFWAYGDIDLVYGNLRSYFTAERLQHKDLLSTHATRVSGHVCLIRNTPEMSGLYQRIPDWQQQFADPTHRAVDERTYSHLFMKHKNLPRPLFKLINSANRLWRRSEFVEAFSTPHARIAWTDGSYRFPSRWFWCDGSLRNDIDGDREFPYFHFIVWKKSAWNTLATLTSAQLIVIAQNKNGWQITESGFFAQ